MHASERFPDGNGRLLAYCIAGHHAGLADWHNSDSPQGSLLDRLTRARDNDMLGRAKRGGAPRSLLDGAPPTDGPRDLDAAGCAFFIRMLFSTLVDADFHDTEALFDHVRGAERGRWPSLSALLPVLDAHLDRKTEEALRDRPGLVNEARRDVLMASRAGAKQDRWLFTLSVPAGGGKTLASLASALRHAQMHGLRRMIYAIPYTSIIEQTADVFREVFEEIGEVVVEHHSSVEPAYETNCSRLAAENWDAPLIVTTTVQLFEPLFAARVSRCRRLHNIAGSVLILDEAQLLPVEFLRPIIFALDELMARYRVSVVLSTVTQPVLMRRDGFAGLKAQARELVPDPEGLLQLNFVIAESRSVVASPSELKVRFRVLAAARRTLATAATSAVTDQSRLLGCRMADPEGGRRRFATLTAVWPLPVAKHPVVPGQSQSCGNPHWETRCLQPRAPANHIEIEQLAGRHCAERLPHLPRGLLPVTATPGHTSRMSSHG